MSLKSIQSDALKNLNFQKECEKKVASSVERGLKEWPGIYKKAMEDLKRQPINIGVTGSSGAGKSSWINSMCHFKRKSVSQYAATDVIECTKEMKAYRHPEIGNIWFWDMPGNNTPNCHSETYLKQVKFEQYDALVLITKDRFTESDLYLAKAAKEHGIPYYFVYSQFDLVIHTVKEMNTNETEEELIEKIGRKIRTELAKAELHPEKIYFISSIPKLREVYDFQELKTKIYEETEKNINNKMRKLKTSLQQICRSKIDENIKLIKETNIINPTTDELDVAAFENLEILVDWFVFEDVHSQQNIEICLANIEQWIDELKQVNRPLVGGIVGSIKGTVREGAGGAIGTAGAVGAVGTVATAASAARGAAAVGGILVAGVAIGITHLINKQKKANLKENISREHDKICDIIEIEAKKLKDQYI